MNTRWLSLALVAASLSPLAAQAQRQHGRPHPPGGPQAALLEGRKAFRRDDFIFLAPFFAYILCVVVSFVSAPYKGPSVDDFVGACRRM